MISPYEDNAIKVRFITAYVVGSDRFFTHVKLHFPCFKKKNKNEKLLGLVLQQYMVIRL